MFIGVSEDEMVFRGGKIFPDREVNNVGQPAKRPKKTIPVCSGIPTE